MRLIPLGVFDVTVLGLVGGAPAQGWGGDRSERASDCKTLASKLYAHGLSKGVTLLA